jgi:hypothetical protein
LTFCHTFPLSPGVVLVQTPSSKTTALQVNAAGEVQYDAILTQSMSNSAIVYSKYTDLVERNVAQVFFFLNLALSLPPCRCGKIHCERAVTHRMSCNAPTKRSNNASPSALVRRWRRKWTARSRRRNPRPTRCKRRNLRTFDTHRVRRSKKTATTRAPSNASFGCKRCPLTHWNRPSLSRRNCPAARPKRRCRSCIRPRGNCPWPKRPIGRSHRVYPHGKMPRVTLSPSTSAWPMMVEGCKRYILLPVSCPFFCIIFPSESRIQLAFVWHGFIFYLSVDLL